LGFVRTDSDTPGPAAPSERPVGLRERKKADLRRRIAEAAIALFRERGYEGTTIDEIVRRVDVSQPTFYKYFASKDAILREHAMTGFASLLAKAAANTGTIEQRMRRYLQGIAQQMTEDRELWYAIAVSNAYNPIRDPELLASGEASTRVLEAVIEEGQRRGEFTIAYSAQRLASLLEGVMFRVCIEWGARFPNTRPLTESVDEGFDLFMRAARPSPADRAPRARPRPNAGTAQAKASRPAPAAGSPGRPTLPLQRAKRDAPRPTRRVRGA
jgi:AcrR family transcriptional regulator